MPESDSIIIKALCQLWNASVWLFTFISIIVISITDFFTSKDVVPVLSCKESALTKHLKTNNGILYRPFRPCKLFANSYVQTLLGYVRWSELDLCFEREYIQMADKGVVAIDWLINVNYRVRKTSTVLVVFPRLTGSAHCVGSLCRVAAEKGFRTVVYNKRGHGSSFLTTPKLTSCGDPVDVRQVIEYIVQKHPKSNVTALGVGAGCALLFSYLGEYGSSSLLKAGVCISPSYDNTEKLCEQIPTFYEFLLLLNLKRMVLSHSKALYKVIDIRAVLRAWSLKEFDYHVYCKMYGFETFDCFWECNDPMRDVDDISVPIMCVNSLDDPVSRHDNIPYDLFEFYPNLLLLTLEKGGHCGFLDGVKLNRWTDRLAVNYLEAVLEFTSSSNNRASYFK